MMASAPFFFFPSPFSFHLSTFHHIQLFPLSRESRFCTSFTAYKDLMSDKGGDKLLIAVK